MWEVDYRAVFPAMRARWREMAARRLNLGRYGGTAEASLTLTGGTVLLVQ